jgi:hypothetical protein
MTDFLDDIDVHNDGCDIRDVLFVMANYFFGPTKTYEFEILNPDSAKVWILC